MIKKIQIIILFAVASFASSAQYPHQNISLLSRWDDSLVTAEPVYDIRYNGCWGWVDSTGREYAIIGSTAGTYIVEVTNPVNPVLRDYIPGRRDSCIWHEYKTYGKYLYIISDDASPNSFQIADLSYLPDSVHLVYDDITIFERAHTLFIDGNKLYCASVTSGGGNYSTMNVYSLANPEQPQLLRKLVQDYPGVNQVHDMLVRNDTVYASCGWQGMKIYKFTSFDTLSEIGVYAPLQSYYNHSSALTDDGKTLFYTNEVPAGLGINILDITDINNPPPPDTFYTHVGATPHNLYMKNGKLVAAYYQDGIYVFNIDNPSTPYVMGYFDTHPQNVVGYEANAYKGCWGAYTDLPSGVLIASDMQLGLFVLDAHAMLGKNELTTNNFQINLFPNPATGKIFFTFKNKSGENVLTELYDFTGRKLSFKNYKHVSSEITTAMDVSKLSPGIYFLKFSGGHFAATGKFVKQ